MEDQMAPKTLARSRIRTGWTRPAWYGTGPFSPVFYADGGEPLAAEPEPDDEPADEPADDWEPPTREEYERLIEGKKKADGEAAARRKYLRQHGIDPKTGNKIEPDEPEPEPAAPKDEQPQGPNPAEIKRQIERAAAEAEIRGLRKTKTLVTSLNDGLSEAGWNGQRLGLLMKLIDLDEVDVDSDGEVTGLAEQIEVAKREFPEAFKRTRNPANASNGAGGSGQSGVPAAKVDAADKPAPKAEPKTWVEQLAERATRG